MTTNKQDRKERPIARGVLDYFPDAIAEVAYTSFVGNQQHNPGEPMHWAREKSGDHADCIVRHLIERGTVDTDGVRHSAKMAWRALALLQLEVEADRLAERAKVDTERDDAPIPTTATIDLAEHEVPPPGRKMSHQEAQDYVFKEYCEMLARLAEHEPAKDAGVDAYSLELNSLGCPPRVAKQVSAGISVPNNRGVVIPWVYISGPMRGMGHFNFPAFDAARDTFLEHGYRVISPADMDRNAGFRAEDIDPHKPVDQKEFVLRDFWALFFLAHQAKAEIFVLPGCTCSVGASAELFLARWLGINAVQGPNTPFPNPEKTFASVNAPRV